jgi:sRNA-binding regulator protein Hfq
VQDGKQKFGGGPSGHGPKGKGGKAKGKPPLGPAAMARKKKIEDLGKQGLPLPLAQAVANGQMTMNDAVLKLQRDDEAARVAKLHGIAHSLAMQVAMGHADLATVLRTRKVEAYVKEHAGRTIFDAVGSSWALGVYGQKTRQMSFLRNDKYEVEVQEAGGEPELLHKTVVKYAYGPADYKLVRKHLEYDKELRAQTVEPRLRPQDRYACSDRKIGAWWEQKTVVRLATMEGEVFTGEIAWFARFEIGLKNRAGVEVVVFRHALADARESRH